MRHNSDFKGLQYFYSEKLPWARFDFFYDGLLRSRHEVGLHRGQRSFHSSVFNTVTKWTQGEMNPHLLGIVALHLVLFIEDVGVGDDRSSKNENWMAVI